LQHWRSGQTWALALREQLSTQSQCRLPSKNMRAGNQPRFCPTFLHSFPETLHRPSQPRVSRLSTLAIVATL
jgi:hypothetical protein